MTSSTFRIATCFPCRSCTAIGGKKSSEEILPLAYMSPFAAAECVEKAFFSHIRHNCGKEPTWATRSSRTASRISGGLRAHGNGCLPDVPCVHYTGLGYVILADGITHDTFNAFGLWRLQDIAQLGKLHGPSRRTAVRKFLGWIDVQP